MSIIAPGFSQPVEHSQSCFRQVLKALSEPGHIVTLDKHLGFAPLCASATQILMSLCDQHTPLYLSPRLEEIDGDATINQAQRNLTFHCNTKPSALVNADFAVVSHSEGVNMARLKCGTDTSPESGTTLLVQSNGFDCGPEFKLTGPGIEHSRTVQLGNLSQSLVEYLVNSCHTYPLGIDILLCHQQQLLAISRTTKVELIPCM
ncbi:phosphonate C-P lyase system protein PhnH [Motilimonas cestriensis]|uniref:Phosphonate C-P lyase system protein PhnH n=1 Tax=Motilimonas cestriensis TaxID=2742685 RepID=A0ABS8WEF4_9GAMM|nr:phosphonate C-P lyase system protein PhnH [Motilimonas cestriensis]MCE2596640.1 phosphonate C-P lyase system protein PhnH [Motilimonas cestriensis]